MATSDLSKFKLRSTAIHAASQRLTLAALPIEAPLGKDTPEETQLTLDGMVLGCKWDNHSSSAASAIHCRA